MATTEFEAIETADPKHVAAVIDHDEFEADTRDPEWRRFLLGAKAHVEELERDGRNR
jgi:hypothetical protein